jgi:SAM-dependent methyltransferase
MTTNAYSALWFKLFLPLQKAEWTQNDVAFLARQLPLPRYTSLLDLGCGQGRHALELARRRYQVTGLDRDEAAIAQARRRARDARQDMVYIVGDMLRLDELPGEFDAIISMWQSFGYFDEETNTALLRQIHRKLTPQGRFIIDLFNRDYFEHHQGVTQQELAGGVSVETHTSLQGNRLHSVLRYRKQHHELGGDHFEFQMFTADEFCAVATESGLTPLLVCTWSNEHRSPSPDVARIQIVLEKSGTQ